MAKRNVIFGVALGVLLMLVSSKIFESADEERPVNKLARVRTEGAQDQSRSDDRRGRQESNNARKVNCTVRLAANGTFPVVALISAPGSGNTWTRHLIEQATGIYTGSVFTDKKLYEGGFIGEFEDKLAGNTLTVKTHNPFRLAKFATSAILLMRNPVDVAIAERNRKGTAKNDHTAVASWDKELRTSRDWKLFVEEQFQHHENVNKGFFELHVPKLVVHFEDMREDPVKEVGRIVTFLNMTMDEDRATCVAANLEGKFHRNATDRQAPYDAFTDAMKCAAKSAMDEMSEFLVDKGFEPLPCLGKYPPSNCDMVVNLISSCRGSH